MAPLLAAAADVRGGSAWGASIGVSPGPPGAPPGGRPMPRGHRQACPHTRGHLGGRLGGPVQCCNTRLPPARTLPTCNALSSAKALQTSACSQGTCTRRPRGASGLRPQPGDNLAANRPPNPLTGNESGCYPPSLAPPGATLRPQHHSGARRGGGGSHAQLGVIQRWTCLICTARATPSSTSREKSWLPGQFRAAGVRFASKSDALQYRITCSSCWLDRTPGSSVVPAWDPAQCCTAQVNHCWSPMSVTSTAEDHTIAVMLVTGQLVPWRPRQRSAAVQVLWGRAGEPERRGGASYMTVCRGAPRLASASPAGCAGAVRAAPRRPQRCRARAPQLTTSTTICSSSKSGGRRSGRIATPRRAPAPLSHPPRPWACGEPGGCERAGSPPAARPARGTASAWSPPPPTHTHTLTLGPQPTRSPRRVHPPPPPPPPPPRKPARRSKQVHTAHPPCAT
jgi:hypothetical protein